MEDLQVTDLPPKRLGWLAVLGMVMLLAGLPLYGLLLDNPLVRATAWPTFAMAAVGAGLGFMAAWRDRRRWVRIVGGANCVLLGLFIIAFFRLAALPPPTAAAETAAAPEFTLPDQDERPTVLRDAYATGPVLLVFYRGHW